MTRIESAPSASVEIAILPLKERLQVRERVVQKRLPLFIAKDDEENREIMGMWSIPGTTVRVSPEGDIYFPVWRERSWVSKPELYASCSDLPQGWSLERLLASKRRPVSEVVFYQVRGDGGAVETAIRSMDHILENYTNKGKETEQLDVIRRQIEQATKVLQETKGVSREEFDRGFEILYKRTVEIMESLGMKRASSALKRDICRLLEEASTGEDATGRRNPIAMLKKLTAVVKRIEYRQNEVGFIVDKFEANKAGLVAQRAKDREITERAMRQLSIGFAGHEMFKYSQTKPTPLQKGIVVGKIGTLIYQLEQVRVKCYKTTAVEVIDKLKEAREKVKSGSYEDAGKIFKESSRVVTTVLNRFALATV